MIDRILNYIAHHHDLNSSNFISHECIFYTGGGGGEGVDLFSYLCLNA